MSRSARLGVLGLVTLLLIASCTTSSPDSSDQITPTTAAPSAPPTSTTTAAQTPTTTAEKPTTTTAVHTVCTEASDDEAVLDDTSTLDNPGTDSAQHPEDGTYRAFDERDGPPSDYAPCFVAADDADLDGDDLVIGVAIGSTVRAYGVTDLIAHPVNDRIDDAYLLVTY